MQVIFSKEGKAYKVRYIGHARVPIIPSLGLLNIEGHTAPTYGGLLEQVITDLGGCGDSIETVFSEGIDRELQSVTNLALGLLAKLNLNRDRLFLVCHQPNQPKGSYVNRKPNESLEIIDPY